jgi:hypothetical protein
MEVRSIDLVLQLQFRYPDVTAKNQLHKFILLARSRGCKLRTDALYGRNLSSFVPKASHNFNMSVSYARCLTVSDFCDVCSDVAMQIHGDRLLVFYIKPMHHDISYIVTGYM